VYKQASKRARGKKFFEAQKFDTIIIGKVRISTPATILRDDITFYMVCHADLSLSRLECDKGLFKGVEGCEVVNINF
jgi:hypothetical protein